MSNEEQKSKEDSDEHKESAEEKGKRLEEQLKKARDAKKQKKIQKEYQEPHSDALSCPTCGKPYSDHDLLKQLWEREQAREAYTDVHTHTEETSKQTSETFQAPTKENHKPMDVWIES